MEVQGITLQVEQWGEPVKVQIAIYKPDELTRYRASISDGSNSQVLIFYRKDDGDFKLFDCGNWMINDLAKKIRLKIMALEKSNEKI